MLGSTFLVFAALVIYQGLSKSLENNSHPQTRGFNEVSTTAVTVPDGYTLAATFTSSGMFSVQSKLQYYVEVCGAKGADNCNNPSGVSYGGLGGCIYSYLSSPPPSLFINVGGKGTCQGGGFNGGGSSNCQFGGGGGGSSDIRTGSSLDSRIVVGGGGGGAGYGPCTALTGGNGGGRGVGLEAGAGFVEQTCTGPGV